MMSKKAKEMHIDVEDLKGWLTSMRAMFGKLSRKKSGPASCPPLSNKGPPILIFLQYKNTFIYIHIL